MYQETSREAFLSVIETLSAVRKEVYTLLVEAGSQGMTQEEIIGHFPDLDQSTPRREVSHLADEGLVKDSGMRRLSSRNRRMIIWVATPPGQKAVVNRCPFCNAKMRHA